MNSSQSVEFIVYAEEHGNRAAEHYFGIAPNEMMRMWRQGDALKAVVGKWDKTCICS